MTYKKILSELRETKEKMDYYLSLAKDDSLSLEERKKYSSAYYDYSAHYLELNSVRVDLEQKEKIFGQAIVKETIAAIRIMWDCRSEKDFYYRVNWLKGLAPEYEEALGMLFGCYAEGHETPRTFAKRIAGIV